jgi:streptomycin 6-kinase
MHPMTVFLDSVRAHATTGELAHNVTTTRGTDAARWLADLPDAVASLCTRWDFTPTAVHPSSKRSLLCTGRLSTGHRAALKVEPRATLQAVSLRAMHRAGHAPRVMAYDQDLNATLLEWVAGARSLTTSLPDALAVCSAVTKINRIQHGIDSLPSVTDRIDTHNHITRARLTAAGAAPFDVRLLDMDAERSAALPPPPAGTGLLHGDLVAANVLLGRDLHVGFIDTDPLCGPPEWDLSHLSLRMNLGAHVLTLPALLRERQPDLDHEMLDWLITRHARGYIGYRIATSQPVSPLVAALAQASRASHADLDAPRTRPAPQVPADSDTHTAVPELVG